MRVKNSDIEIDTNGRVWCRECGPHTAMVLSLPQEIHCAECNTSLAELETPVNDERVAFFASEGVIKSFRTGETLSGVTWYSSTVEFHASAASWSEDSSSTGGDW